MDVQPQEASLTVNEQVIVMSSHETIRVLEVGVDAPLPAEDDGKALEPTAGEVASSCPVETSEPGREDVQANLETTCGGTTGEVKSLPGIAPASVSSVTTFSPATSQPTQTLTPLAVQAAPQVLTQENLATVVTGVMVPAGAVTQPLLIPISIAGQVAGQQGLAVWTFPTATVAALPGLTAASPTGGIFKPPIANLQAAAVLNTAVPTPVQPAQPLQAPQTVQPRPSIQTQAVFQPQPSLQSPPAILPQPAAAPPPPAGKPLETQTQITVQPAGFAFNPGIISAASLGGQTQLLSSLAAAPVIANTIPSVQGITSQILTNAQGQVIGTLPWVVNPAGITTASATPAVLPAQNLQVQAVTPQLLLNAQGQVIATLASSALQTAAIRKPSAPESPAKNEIQPIQPAPALPQPAVVIANPAPAAKPSSVPVPITCSETPTVSQLVSKPQTPNTGIEEDGINLEEIREFAKNFKIRRLSLGLTQTQVGQALTATEGPAYSQSAICSDVLALPIFKQEESSLPPDNENKILPFQYVLCAATSPAVKLHDETLTYLNQGQSYEIRMLDNRKIGELPEINGKLVKSIFRVVFHDRRLQYTEHQQLEGWRWNRPGDRILDIDIPMSVGIIDPRANPTQLNTVEFLWDPSKRTSVFIQVHCISTEFTMRKHGGEKGVPFRVQIDTFKENENGEYTEHLHSASCQIKVFKPKGADRKQKTDREKMEKRTPHEKEKYQPSYETTILTECSPWPEITYVNNAPSPGFNSSHSSFSIGEGNGSPNHQPEPPPPITDVSPTSNLMLVNLLPTTTPQEAQQWLHRNRFSTFSRLFTNFSGADLLKLTREDVIQICGPADGIRLFNALKGRMVRPRLTIYVCQEPQQLRDQQKHEDGELANSTFFVYHAIYLEELTAVELTEKIAQLFSISARQISHIYKQGPTGIHVLISDEMIQNFQDESCFVLDTMKAETNDSYHIILK
nr:uncharacterized protein LOC125627635 isoform X3 [Caretta caretta]